jgi:SNW domain-containing protein 1
MALSSLLPAPKNVSSFTRQEPVKQIALSDVQQPQQTVPVTKPTFVPPAYGNRKGWIPKKEEHFGGGGAFPEIYVTQFPLGMGRKDKKTITATESNTLALVVNKDGEVQHDQIIRQGQRSDKIIYSKFTDLIEAPIGDDTNSLAKPSEEEEKKATEETRLALERKLNVKIGATHKSAPQSIQEGAQPQQDATFFRYTPANGSDETRIVRMVEAPLDPLEPPKFHNKKMPRKPPSPPVTVMHSPNKKLTKADLENWKIVPCVSNWKNPKGYTIPLDKRLAADGRGLQEVQINDGFATFSEALYIAERKARQEIEDKGKLQKMLLIKQNEEREEKLRMLAQKARHARIGGMNEEDRSESTEARKRIIDHHLARENERDEEVEEEEEEQDEEERKRNRLREERARDRDRERRRTTKLGKKRANAAREEEEADDGDRDITEKIALGQVRASNAADQIDSRLYNFSSGLDSGFASEDSYSLYDKPLTGGSSVNQIYRPRQEAIDEYTGGDIDALMSGTNDRFAKSKSFQGSNDPSKQSSREGLGPVQFEREHKDDEEERPSKSERRSKQQPEEDAFGFGEFMSGVGKGKKRTLDHIGQRGFMAANAGSSTGVDAESYRDNKRKRINFESSKE